jgi:hypothetical protein
VELSPTRAARRAARCITAAAVLLAIAALPPGAAARKPVAKAFWGPTQLNGSSQFPVYEDLGVSIFQMQLHWNEVASTRPAHPRDPSDPAYQWPKDIGYAVRQAKKHHIRVLLMFLRTPAWANGGKDPSWAPNDPRDFADFAYAASRHYGGVHLWMIWGEPTTVNNFQPLTKDGPRVYARVLDAGYGALKKRSKSNRVIGGNSFTAGDIKPDSWVSDMRLPNGRPPRLDLYGHNPFGNRKPDLTNPPSGNGFEDFSDLRRFNKRVDANLGTKHRPHLRLFISEWAEATAPGDSEFGWYLSPLQQASWIKAGFGVARAVGAYALGWIHLYDTPETPEGYVSNSGLLDAAGNRKPGYGAFKHAKP